MTIPVLYQFPVSHYCEKVRWALDLKGVQYRTHNMIPVFHAPTMLLKTRQRLVPALRMDASILTGSERILQALDERYPQNPLLPEAPAARENVLALARLADKEVGVHVRRCAYYHALADARFIEQLLGLQQGPLGRTLLKASLPAVIGVMRKGLGIHEKGYARSVPRLLAVMDQLEQAIQPSGYLVGDRFSMADLTAAALLAPLIRPEQAPYQMPDHPPQAFLDFCESFAQRPLMQWVQAMYRQHRPAPICR